MKIEYKVEGWTSQDKKFFYEMIPYVSTHIEKIEKNPETLFIYTQPCFQDDVKEKLAFLKDMVIKEKLNGKEMKIETLEDYTNHLPLNEASIFPELVEKEMVKEILPGVFAYSQLFLKIYRYFSDRIEEFARETFPGINEYEFPVLYPVKDFEKGGYFANFPHYIMFQTEMKNDIEVLDRFAKEGTKDKKIFEEMKVPSNVLRNATCVPVYGFLENQKISIEEPKQFLVSGRCFRNEAENVLELSRLNEFYMKEYVFVGTPSQCNDQIKKAKGIWNFFVDTFQLNAKLDTANDSFFASNYKKLKLFQILGDSKQEFKCLIPGQKQYISCSSANFHRTHFTKPYEIKSDDGSYCYSACFAFGVDRLTYAFLSQKGLDPHKWDEPTVNELIKYVNING